MRRLAVALLVAFSILGAASAASAATDDPGAIIQYSGTGTVTTLSDGSSSSYPVTWTVDCTGLPCTITGVLSDAQSNTSFALTGGIAQPFVGGRGTYSFPDTGDKCDASYTGPYTIVIVAVDDRMDASFDLGDGGQVDCPDGSTVEYDASHVDISTTAVSGNTCFIFATCPTATATPVDAAPPVLPGDTYTDGTTIAAPSTLSTLPTLASALTPQNATWAVAMTTVLAILVALPSHLLNVTLEHASGRLAAWRRRGRPAPPADRPPAGGVSWKGWPLAAGGVLVASVVSSFVNPAFGLNGSSIRVFLSILVSFILDAVAGWFLVIWLVRRTTPGIGVGFRFVPATLVLVVAAVAFSRLTGFQPGIVFGLVAGVVFGAALAAAQKARVALLPLAYSFVVAMLGWIGYSILTATAGSHPDGGALFARETLSAITIAGLAALPIALIPLRGLAGYEVFAWNRWAWGASYAVGLLGFFLVLMPLPYSWQAVGLSVWAWVAIYVAYALLAVLAWVVVVRPWRPSAAVEAEDEPAALG